MSTPTQPVEDAAEARLLAVDEASLRLVDLALAEDIGPGDWTSRWTVPPRARLEGALVAGERGVVAGVAVAAAVFRRLNPRMEVGPRHADGDEVRAGDVVLSLRGPARAILAGERTALDFLRRLSGVATQTRRYVEALADTGAVVLGGGNGTPGWRVLEAAACQAGGARAHRLGLFDVVTLRAPHIALVGSVAEAVRRVRDQNSRGLAVEVEVSDEAQAAEAASAGADTILLLSADPEAVRAAGRAIQRARPRPLLAVAADVTPKAARALAEAGAQAILVQALPQGAPPLPLTLALGTR
ncbi:MAG TPA: carboxylating nicotinate-nucleotide diphosphorylase [Longimicrobiales bacterium]